MDDVKATLSKSSREISQQMKKDMEEVRGELALMRDDFGIGIPRELRKMIASSELARDALLALSEAFYGIAFIGLGVEAIQKVAEYFSEADKQAQEETKHTLESAAAAQKLVEATRDREYQLELIGKGEDERYQLEKAHFEEEIKQNQARLVMLQAQVNAKLALLNADELSNQYSTDPFQNRGDENEEAQKANDRREQFAKDTEEVRKQISDVSKAIQEAQIGLANSEKQYSDYNRQLGLERIKNEEDVAASEIELKKGTAEKLFAAGALGIDQELLALRTAATEKYNLEVDSLNKSLAILEQDPSRNREKIDELHAKLIEDEKSYQLSMIGIYQLGVTERQRLGKQEEEALKEEQRVMQELSKKAFVPGDIASSFGSDASRPQLQIDMVGAAIQRFAGDSKDAAAQNKLLEQTMDATLKPMDQFRIIQGEVNLLLQNPDYKNSPQVLKALHDYAMLANPEFQKLRDASTEFGHDLSNELDQLVLHGKTFSQVLQDIALDIAEIALKATLLKPLEDFFSGGKSGTGGFLGMISGLFGGFFADGGDPPTGRVSIVGEQGPELFVPKSSGTIIPNGKLGGSTIVNNFDFRGAQDDIERKVQLAVQRGMAQSVKASVAASVEYQKRR
jgi:hypothetical protein